MLLVGVFRLNGLLWCKSVIMFIFGVIFEFIGGEVSVVIRVGWNWLVGRLKIC